MKYDFEKIGKERVLNELQSKILGKATYMKNQANSTELKLEVLEEINQLSGDAYTILKELSEGEF